MLVLLIPFNVEPKQAKACFLGKRNSPDRRGLRTFALLNEVTEFDARISGGVTGLSCVREELFELVFSNSDRSMLEQHLSGRGDFYLD